jgi:rhodanese-related sulfurtransferase
MSVMLKSYLGVLLCVGLSGCAAQTNTSIGQQALLQALGSKTPPLIIDVRSDAEYASGHIQDALHVPFWRSFTTNQLEGVEPNRAIVLTCQHGPRAVIARWGFSWQGFNNLRYLEGHMAAWSKAGLSQTKAVDR